MLNSIKIAVIGGGAAGFFAAISAKTNFPDCKVDLFEKSGKLLSKVKVSGGGRCNVTNGISSLSEFSKGYPRGSKVLKKALHVFNNADIQSWFESRGVPLYVQDDNRVFPISDSSQSIIDCLLAESSRLGIQIKTRQDITALKSVDGALVLTIAPTNISEVYDRVIIATGGSPKRSGLQWLSDLGHKIVEPVPSLFTFNMPGASITKLMGLSAPNVIVRVQGTKLKSEGPLLITHWGMSGPVILKLSSFGARDLNNLNYDFRIQVNWSNKGNDEIARNAIEATIKENSGKRLSKTKLFNLPERLWLYLLQKCEVNMEKRWDELGKKGLNKLVNVLTNDIYEVKGKTTFKEEFVTCGGISLDAIDPKTMQSKVCKNLYFAGEILDIDGITGGYNFQAAWTTGFIAGQLK